MGLASQIISGSPLWFVCTDNFRFATVKYDHTGKNLWNPCMHLCNYSINKYHSGFSTSLFFALFVHTNYEILIIQKTEILTIFLADYIKSSDPDLDDQVTFWGKLFKRDFSQKKYLTNDNWMLYHIRATNGLWVPFSSTWRRTTLTRSNWCRASRTWSSRSWYSRNIFLISCRSPRSYKYSIFLNFVNILSITCRRSSALSFRWTQPARCLSHIGTHQTLQFCILYFVFCICICIFEIWNTT